MKAVLKKKVLHIVEITDEDIELSLNNYLLSTRHMPLEHYLLAKVKKNSTYNKDNSAFNHSNFTMVNFFAFMMKIKKSIKEINPDIIHLHSTLAGFLGRFLPKAKHKIIYTPHCYAFEKPHISSRMRMLLIWMEGFRLHRIDTIAGSSKRECYLAYNLGAKESIYLNGFANLQPSTKIAPANPPPINIFVVGQLSKQKDPHFLIKTMRILKKNSKFNTLKFYWLGGGEKKLTQLLEKNGVRVSGVLPREKRLQQLQKAHLFIHTSAWDGAAVTLLEAAKLHIPSLVRFTPALQEVPYPFIAQSPKAMAKQIIRYMKQPYHPDYLMSLNIFNQAFTEEKQRVAFEKLYEI